MPSYPRIVSRELKENQSLHLGVEIWWTHCEQNKNWRWILQVVQRASATHATQNNSGAFGALDADSFEQSRSWKRERFPRSDVSLNSGHHNTRWYLLALDTKQWLSHQTHIWWFPQMGVFQKSPEWIIFNGKSIYLSQQLPPWFSPHVFPVPVPASAVPRCWWTAGPSSSCPRSTAATCCWPWRRPGRSPPWRTLPRRASETTWSISSRRRCPLGLQIFFVCRMFLEPVMFFLEVEFFGNVFGRFGEMIFWLGTVWSCSLILKPPEKWPPRRRILLVLGAKISPNTHLPTLKLSMSKSMKFLLTI